MNFFRWLKNCFAKLFGMKARETEDTTCEELDQEYSSLLEQASEPEGNVEKFQIKNVIFEKLNYLEEYIKGFSRSFPSEYQKYQEYINRQRAEYEEELTSYNQAFTGNIAFAIDPEAESRRIAQVAELEKVITHFADYVVLYSMYKDKFSTLCGKLNQFYNALVNYHIAQEQVLKQIANATQSAEKLVAEVQKLTFFEQDARKREEILNYLVYCDYMLFKIAVRYGLCPNLYEYKCNTSKFYRMFIDAEYDKLIFKFFVQDLEHIQAFITTNLQAYESNEYLLSSCEQLQIKLQDFASATTLSTYFEELLKLENTLEEVAKTFGMDFMVNIPKMFGTVAVDNISICDIAISILKLINNSKAKLLLEIIKGFKVEISWEELYFLCKVFDLYNDVILVSKNTVFSSLATNFLELDKKYPEYSSANIAKKKLQLLNYNGSRKKKYVVLFDEGSIDYTFAAEQLTRLYLDYVVVGSTIYINHSYFSGFKNLEHIFGNYTTF